MDKRNNFTSQNGCNVDAITTTNGNISNSNSCNNGQTTTNGTISNSDSSDSIEPPKQLFINNKNDFTENINVCNEQSNDSDIRNNVGMENFTDSVLQNQSNDENTKIHCNLLSDDEKNHVYDTQENSLDVNKLNSVLLLSPSSLAISDKQINNQNENLVDNDDNSHNHQPYNIDYEKVNADNSIESIERIDKNSDPNGRCINISDNNDCFNRSNTNDVEITQNTLNDNLASIESDNLYNLQIESLVPVSRENCKLISDIDVKPTKCPTNKSQTATENQEIGCYNTEIKENTNNIESKSQMDADHSLRTPLLGKNSTRNKTIDYNAIERQAYNDVKGNVDINGKSVAYNDYVNSLCDTDKNKEFPYNNGHKSSMNNKKDENRPLLQQSMSYDGVQKFKRKSIQKPKSIVKSPSTQNFSSNNSEKFYEANRKPRLSIQCTGSDPERPVLHVQFLSQHSNDKDKALKSNMMNHSPSNGEHDSSRTGASQQEILTEKQPEELINQMPTRSILRTTRMRSSISSNSSESSSSSSSDSSSSDDVSQFAEAKPPDGGYGWVIVFASFMVNLIADGITFSFGVIYVELLKYFGEGKAKTAWIGSLFMAMPLLSGPIASFLTDRYGCRKVTIVGSILAAIGFIISSFTDSVEMLFLTFGVFAGFGLSMCYVAAVVVVAYYFDKRRSFATGLSVCGSGIGTFVFAPVTQMLIDEYGWRGTTLILAGMFLNMTVCGALMRDLEWTTYKSKQKAKLRRKRNKLGISADSFSVSNSTNTGTTSNLQKDDPNGNELDRSDENNGDNSLANQSDSFDDSRLFSSLINLPTFVKNGEKVPVEVLELMSSNKHVNNVLFKNYSGLAHSRSFSQPLTSSRHSNGSNLPFESSMSPSSPTADNENGLARTKSRRVRNEEAFLTWLKHDSNHHNTRNVHMIMNRNPTAYLKDLRMHRHSLTYRGAMLNINRYRLRASSCPDIYRNSMTTIAKEKTQWGQGLDEFKSVLIDMLDFSFFRDIRFTLFALSNFLLYAWYDVPYVYLADNAVKIGFSETDASILISMIGIVNMVGEIILGWFGDRKFITAGMIYAICMVFCGLVCGLVPLLSSYTGLSVLSGLFGLFIAANYALTSIILVELISLERFTNAYGLLLLVQGIANLIGPPLAGWITDLTGNYDLAFYLAGFFIAASGLFMMFLPARGRIQKYRKFRRQYQSSCDSSSSDDEDVEKCEPPAIQTNHITTTEAPKSALRYNGSVKSNKITINEV